jgi:hypothetical protein
VTRSGVASITSLAARNIASLQGVASRRGSSPSRSNAAIELRAEHDALVGDAVEPMPVNGSSTVTSGWISIGFV